MPPPSPPFSPHRHRRHFHPFMFGYWFHLQRRCWGGGGGKRCANCALQRGPSYIHPPHPLRRARTTLDGDGDRARHLIRGEPTHTHTHTRVLRPASFVLQTFSVLFERRPWMQGRRRTAVSVVLRSRRTNSEKTTSLRQFSYLHELTYVLYL